MRPTTWDLPFGECTLLPAGCIHWPLGDKQLLRSWIKRVLAVPNGFTILMGDSLDGARTHYRNHLRTYREDSNSQIDLDGLKKRQVAELAEELEPIKDRIMGVVLGNHYWEFADGTNSEQFLCHLLGVRYLGPMAFVRLDFHDGAQGRKYSLKLWAHHHGGSKGGRTRGGDINVLERSEHSFEADIYLLGHTHQRHGYKNATITISDNGKPFVVERPTALIRTGAFLKGMDEDTPSNERPHFPSYAEVGALRPTDLGWVELSIRFRRPTGGPEGRPSYLHEFTLHY